MKKLFVMLIVLAAVAPSWANLVYDPGFESGVAFLGSGEGANSQGWWVYLNDPANENAAVVSSPAIGNYSAELYTGNGSSAQIGHDMDAVPGMVMSVSLKYMVPEGSWNGAGVTLQYLDSSWTYINYAYAEIFNYGSTGGGTGLWEDFSASSGEGVWTAPEGTAHISFKIEQWGWESGASHFDDIIVTPEPATMIMLSLGGLALIRRKRA